MLKAAECANGNVYRIYYADKNSEMVITDPNKWKEAGNGNISWQQLLEYLAEQIAEGHIVTNVSQMGGYGSQRVAFRKDPLFQKILQEKQSGAHRNVSVIPEGGEIYINTPAGMLHAYPATDPNHPGIYTDIKKYDADYETPLTLTEFTKVDDEGTDTDSDEGNARIITRVWGDEKKEDCTEAITHEFADCNN